MTARTIAREDAIAAVLATAPQWTPGRRKRDGKPFYFVPSSGTGSVVYMVAEDGCTCPAAFNSYSGDCKHQQAVRRYNEQRDRRLGLASQGETDLAFASLALSKRGNGADRPIKTYEMIWGAED